MLTPKLQMLEDTIKRLCRRNASGPLEKVVAKARSADLAFIIARLANGERRTLLERCPDVEKRAEILGATEPDVGAQLLQVLGPERAVELLHHIEPDDVSDLLEHLPEELADDLLLRMKGTDRTEVEELARYDSETAGGIMSPRFFALHRDTTAQQAIQALHSSEDVEMAFYVYVTNELEQLLGVVSLRQLVISRPETTLFDMMTSDVITVTPDVDQEDVSKVVSRYGFLAIPVVDDGNKLLGIVTIDDVIDVIREEATEDILRMAGAGDELKPRTVIGTATKRFPWLLVTGAGGALAALLLATYAELLRSFQPVIFFIPVVLALAGVVGMQSATFITRNIAVGRLSAAGVGRALLRQIATGLLLGLLSGVLMALFCWLWLYQHPALTDKPMLVAAAVLGAGIAASMTTASALGGVMPILFQRIRVDPTLATGPFVAVAADVVGLLIYLSISSAYF